MTIRSQGSCKLDIGYITDRHAYTVTANFYNRLEHLDQIDWLLLQRRNFQRDSDDPEKVERYQAEAMVRGQVPIHALLGVVCYTERAQEELQKQVDRLGIGLNIHCLPHWYF